MPDVPRVTPLEILRLLPVDCWQLPRAVALSCNRMLTLVTRSNRPRFFPLGASSTQNRRMRQPASTMRLGFSSTHCRVPMTVQVPRAPQ